jgi:hypothetical protein
MQTTASYGRRRVSSDVAVQRRHDTKRPLSWPQYEARYAAVIAARQAVRQGEPGSRFALRQALVDMAAVCEAIASPMTAPNAIDC